MACGSCRGDRSALGETTSIKTQSMDPMGRRSAQFLPAQRGPGLVRMCQGQALMATIRNFILGVDNDIDFVSEAAPVAAFAPLL